MYHMIPFGCEVHVTLPPELRTKNLTEPRAHPGIFLGYVGIATNVYRMYSLESRSVKVVRDVTFIEDSVPARYSSIYAEHFKNMKKMDIIDKVDSRAMPPPSMPKMPAILPLLLSPSHAEPRRDAEELPDAHEAAASAVRKRPLEQECSNLRRSGRPPKPNKCQWNKGQKTRQKMRRVWVAVEYRL